MKKIQEPYEIKKVKEYPKKNSILERSKKVPDVIKKQVDEYIRNFEKCKYTKENMLDFGEIVINKVAETEISGKTWNLEDLFNQYYKTK